MFGVTFENWIDSTGALRIMRKRGALADTGDDLFPNYNFSADITGIVNPTPTRATLSHTASGLLLDSTSHDGGLPSFYVPLSTAIGTVYRVEWEMLNGTTTGVNAPGVSVPVTFGNGKWAVQFEATATTTNLYVYAATGVQATFPYVRVRPVL